MSTDSETISQYNFNAEAYHQHVSDPKLSTFHAYYEKPAIRAELPSLHGLDVISIGCGSGVDTRWLADNGANKAIGIDISAGLIEIAREKHPDLEFHEMDMEKLEFPDESFDLAYSSLAIHYLKDWTDALKEAHRVLKNGGKYVFSCGHPIEGAVEYSEDEDHKYALLGRKINKESRDRKVYGDYLAVHNEGANPIKGTLAAFDVTTYQIPFGKMIEQIMASGFTIEKLVEPLPTDEMKQADPAIYDQLTKIPFFMIWVLKKQ